MNAGDDEDQQQDHRQVVRHLGVHVVDRTEPEHEGVGTTRRDPAGPWIWTRDPGAGGACCAGHDTTTVADVPAGGTTAERMANQANKLISRKTRMVVLHQRGA